MTATIPDKTTWESFPHHVHFPTKQGYFQNDAFAERKPLPPIQCCFLQTPRDQAFFWIHNNAAFRGGGEERTGTATMFRKMLPKYAILSTVLSKIVVTILNYLLHIFWLLFSFYSNGLLVILETNVTCIRLKYIKRTPCIRPKFVPRFCVNLLCLLFTLLAAIGWQTVNLQMNQTVKYQGAFSRITGFSGKRFLPPTPPRSPFRLSISFAFPPTQ